MMTKVGKIPMEAGLRYNKQRFDDLKDLFIRLSRVTWGPRRRPVSSLVCNILTCSSMLLRKWLHSVRDAARWEPSSQCTLLTRPSSSVPQILTAS